MDARARRKIRLRVWHKLLIPVLSVGVFFGAAEGLLAVVGVQPLSVARDPFVGFADYAPLFVRESTPGGDAVLRTARNKLRFFNDQSFPAEKPEGVRRVFCLGGSTTYGRPFDDRTSFAGWLRALLPVVDPDSRWEVINAGGISYASYRVARVMEELAGYEPDLFVIYTGHNEFLEERSYGHLRDVPPALRAASSLVSRTRTATVLQRALDRAGLVRDDAREGRERLKSEVDPMLERFSGLDAYERDDALRDAIVAHYEVSLRRMVAIARDADARILFVTPASNLKDCAPFKPQPTDGLDDDVRTRSSDALARSRTALWNGEARTARAAIEDALRDDPRNAELLYEYGRALLGEGRGPEARRAFRDARDEDVCPLRALTALQEALERVASDTGVPVVDYVDICMRESERRAGTAIPGSELFLDHVHPTIEAHRVLAVAIVDELVDLGVVTRTRGWSAPEVAAAGRRVRESVDVEDRARALGYLAQVLRWAGKIEEAGDLARRSLALAPEDARPTMAASRALADAALRRGDVATATEHIRRALGADPRSPITHFQYGLMYLNRANRDIERAAAHLFLTTAIDPDQALAVQTLGLAMAERGRYDLAYRFLRRARELDPDDAETTTALRRLESILGDDAETVGRAELVYEGEPGELPTALGQAIRGPHGKFVRDGIWTEWHPGGEPRRFVVFVRGTPRGTEVVWDADGETAQRIVHPP